MDDCYRNLSRIPVCNVAACLDLPDIEAILDPGQIVSEPVGHQKRLFICGLDNILQSVQLPVMELHDLAGIGINGTVRKLGELPCQRGSIGGGYFAIRQLQD